MNATKTDVHAQLKNFGRYQSELAGHRRESARKSDLAQELVSWQALNRVNLPEFPLPA